MLQNWERGVGGLWEIVHLHLARSWPIQQHANWERGRESEVLAEDCEESGNRKGTGSQCGWEIARAGKTKGDACEGNRVPTPFVRPWPVSTVRQLIEREGKRAKKRVPGRQHLESLLAACCLHPIAPAPSAVLILGPFLSSTRPYHWFTHLTSLPAPSLHIGQS